MSTSSMQQEKILAFLKQAPATFAELERLCDTPNVAARIQELRCAGYRIETQWIQEPHKVGTLRRVCVYLLRPFVKG